MSENLKRRLEILEAFAQSKPTEFDGFALQWERENPVIQQSPASQEPLIVNVEESKIEAETPSVMSEEVEVKPKRSRKQNV